MSEPFTVDVTQLDQLIARLADFDRRAEQWCADVDHKIEQLHQNWSGDTARAQKAAHDRWMRGTRAMRAALEELRVAARNGHGNYSAAVRAGQAMWP